MFFGFALQFAIVRPYLNFLVLHSVICESDGAGHGIVSPRNLARQLTLRSRPVSSLVVLRWLTVVYFIVVAVIYPRIMFGMLNHVLIPLFFSPLLWILFSATAGVLLDLARDVPLKHE